MVLNRIGKGFTLDIVVLACAFVLVTAGMITMKAFGADGATSNVVRQLVFLLIGVIGMGVLSAIDISFFKRSSVVLTLYGVGIVLLAGLFILGSTIKGAQAWYDFGFFSLQPADPMKLFLILVLAKYLSRRHVEIARWKHLIISGIYFFIPFALVFLQPDFGSAMILGIVWFGMLLVSGLSRRHLLIFTMLGLVVFGVLWGFIWQPYQKERLMTFVHPERDIAGAGYNAYQSMVAVGSGRLLGKGVGFGTQSRLSFLPENETDFIFASFAEEWGFVGSVLVLLLFLILITRIIVIAKRAASPFESMVALGIAIYFMGHLLINVGMNIGLLPVSGVTLPFMSYGGSHLVTEFLALGLVMSIRRYRQRASHPDEIKHEFVGY